MQACELELRAASLFLRDRDSFSAFSVFLFVFGVFNLSLMFFSVNATLGGRNTSLRLSFVRQIPCK